MNIRIEWYNETQNVILWRFPSIWTHQDYDLAFDHIGETLQSRTLKGLIFDLTESQISPSELLRVMSQLLYDLRYQKIVLILMVSNPIDARALHALEALSYLKGNIEIVTNPQAFKAAVNHYFGVQNRT